MVTENRTYTFTDDGTAGTDTINAVRASLQGFPIPVNFTISGLLAKWTAQQIQSAIAQTTNIIYNSSTQIFTYTPPKIG